VESRLFQELAAREETNRTSEALLSSAKAALEKGDITAGMNALRHSYETRPDAISARNLALACLHSGDILEARRLLGEALRMSPRDAASYNYLGLLESRDGKLSLGKQYFEKAVELDSSFRDALYNAGLAAAKLGEIEIALQRFKAAMTLEDSAQVREALAVTLEQAGRLEEARDQFDAAEKLKRTIRSKH
jgi:tetratricopeptide (TPR) repeat protein